MKCDKDNIVFQPHPKDSRFQDLTGQVFARLTVLGYAGNRHHNSRWFCICECGNVTQVSTNRLKTSHTASCGCLSIETVRKRATTHGDTVGGLSPEYRCYIGAKSRCNNPNLKCFDRYGGRGVEFRFDSFEDFLAEVGRKPTAKHSLDRIDNDGYYEAGNVRWATQIEQARNKRNSHLLTYNGVTQPLVVWCEQFGVKYGTARERLADLGWSSEQVLFGK